MIYIYIGNGLVFHNQYNLYFPKSHPNDNPFFEEAIISPLCDLLDN